MPKTLALDPTSLDTLARLVADTVCASLRQPGPHEEQQREIMHTTLDIRTTALHAALQCEHEPQKIMDAAQRFVQFLQQGM